MFIKPHPFIKKVEQNENISLSVFRLNKVKKIDTPKDKFEMVYVNSQYPTSEFNEAIYKTKGGSIYCIRQQEQLVTTRWRYISLPTKWVPFKYS